MLRDRLRQGEQVGVAAAATMSSGGLVSDEVVNGMVEERLRKADASKGFVLDGYPRTVAQAGRLCGWLAGRGERGLVISLALDYNSIIRRLAGRRECPRCGTPYNLVSQPPRQDEVCDLDGTRLVARADDTEGAIRERLEAYERQTRPVLEYFQGCGLPAAEVDAGGGPPETVFQRVCQALEANDRSENRG